MADDSGIKLKERLEVLGQLQTSARECLAYVTSVSEASRKLNKTVKEHHIFTSLYLSNERLALLFAAHLVEDDKQSISAKTTAQYAKTHLSEFLRFHATNSARSENDRNADLLAILDGWIARFNTDPVVANIKHSRDWTLAHTDKRSITRPEDVPGLPFADIRKLLGIVNVFVNDLLIRIEDRGLESGEAILEPYIEREVFETVARLTITAEIFEKEIEEQGVGPALKRVTELRKLLGGET